MFKRQLQTHESRAKRLGHLWWYKPTEAFCYEEALFSAIEQNLRFASLDTEFIPSGATEKPRLTEVGFSYIEDGGIRTHHLVLGKGKPQGKRKRFRYGYTKRCETTQELQVQLQQLYAKADVILVWNGNQDLKMLSKVDCAPPVEKVLEISTWQQCPGTRNVYYKLAHFCQLHGIIHVGQHNAGNDAYALLKAVLTAAGVIGPQGTIEEMAEVL